MSLFPPVPGTNVSFPLHLQVLNPVIILEMVTLNLKPTLAVCQANLDPFHFWVSKEKLRPLCERPVRIIAVTCKPLALLMVS